MAEGAYLKAAGEEKVCGDRQMVNSLGNKSDAMQVGQKTTLSDCFRGLEGNWKTLSVWRLLRCASWAYNLISLVLSYSSPLHTGSLWPLSLSS